eukprot:1321869-Rhodomonas_salina.2
MSLRAWYAVCGTEVAYGATSGSERERERATRRDLWYATPMAYAAIGLHAMSGTDAVSVLSAYAPATRCPLERALSLQVPRVPYPTLPYLTLSYPPAIFHAMHTQPCIPPMLCPYWTSLLLRCYALATRCPLLTKLAPMRLRACYAVPGAEVGYAATRKRE